MTYRINLDESGGRWMAVCDDNRSAITGTERYPDYPQAREACISDAKRLKALRVWITTRGHEPDPIDLA
jgi:hypothetical protein